MTKNHKRHLYLVNIDKVIEIFIPLTNFVGGSRYEAHRFPPQIIPLSEVAGERWSDTITVRKLIFSDDGML